MTTIDTMRSGKKIARFGPKLPEVNKASLASFFREYNLLGYDNGDGELACCKVEYDANKGKPYAVPLVFSKTVADVTHVANLLVFNKQGLADLASQDLEEEVYHNFKRCPGLDAEQNYQNDQGKPRPYTYAALMSHSFGRAVRQLFDCNRNLDRKKPTIIMVGHPSSQKWQKESKEYARILGEKLESYLPGPHGAITILVLAESCAAMAGAIEMNQRNWLEAITQILDLGSSTFDITTVTPKGIPPEGEVSFQFGGNQLDQAITHYGDSLFEKKYPAAEGYAMAEDPGKITKLRFKKELCYGDNGSNLNKRQDSYSYYVTQRNKAGAYRQMTDCDGEMELTLPFLVSQHTMNTVLTNPNHLAGLCCTAKNLDDPFQRHTDFSGWMEACQFVMREFYTKTKHLYDAYGPIPRRLIVTGGVSNMPEVQACAKEIFGVEKVILAENPSLTVSKGLALVLGNEILKKSILSELEQELLEETNVLPGADTLLEQIIRKACEADLNYYEKVIERWAGTQARRSLNDCIHEMGNPDNGIFDAAENFIDRACESWFTEYEINTRIEEMLQRKFNQLFPTFSRHFQATVYTPKMEDMSTKHLHNTFPINPYMFFDPSNCQCDPFDQLDSPLTQKERWDILQVFRRHRSGLAAGTDPVSFGPDFSIVIDDSGATEGTRYVGTTMVVECIASVYRRQLSVDEDAKPLRKKIGALLKPQIEDFVESLTYYLALG